MTMELLVETVSVFLTATWEKMRGFFLYSKYLKATQGKKKKNQMREFCKLKRMKESSALSSSGCSN